MTLAVYSQSDNIPSFIPLFNISISYSLLTINQYPILLLSSNNTTPVNMNYNPFTVYDTFTATFTNLQVYKVLPPINTTIVGQVASNATIQQSGIIKYIMQGWDTGSSQNVTWTATSPSINPLNSLTYPVTTGSIINKQILGITS